MTTPLFVDVGGNNALESWLIQMSGAQNGSRQINYTRPELADIPATAPKVFDVQQDTNVIAASYLHPLLMWQQAGAKFAFVPGPGCFGRTVTLHYAWAAPGVAAPKSALEMRQLAGYVGVTFGGVGDPNFRMPWVEIPFSQGRHRLISSNILPGVSALRLYYYIESEDVAPKPPKGVLVTLRVEGLFDVYGNFF